ncbi:unnamed protein product, partial [marine sediment metagenome]
MSNVELVQRVLEVLLGSRSLDDTITIPAAADPANDVSLYGALRRIFDETTVVYNEKGKIHEVADVVIYPVAEDLGTAELDDDGSSPALLGAVSDIHITEGAAVADPAWTEDINFEQLGTITILSIYFELHWQQRLTVGIGAATESLAKWQISGDG